MGGFSKYRGQNVHSIAEVNDKGSTTGVRHDVAVGGNPSDDARADSARQEAVRRIVHGDPDNDVPGLIEQGGQAERNFLAVMQAVGKKGSPSDIAMVADVLGALPVERASELLQMGGNPQSVLDVLSRRAAPEAGDIDPGDASAMDADQQLTPAQRKSLADKQEYALTRKDKSKPVREYDSWQFENTHPLDRPGTYDPRYAKFMRDSFEQRAKGAARYEGDERPLSEVPAYQQKDILYGINRDFADKLYGFQEGALRGLKLSPEVLAKLTPEQVGILSGAAPDQITPEVLQRLYGVPLTDDIIRGMGLQQRTALVGYPQMTEGDWRSLSGYDDAVSGAAQRQAEFDQDRRSRSSADQKIQTLMAAATQGRDAVVNPAAFVPPWRGQFQVVNPLTGLLAPSPNAPSGRFLAGQIFTSAKVDNPEIITQLTPLLDRSVRHYASLPPASKGFRNAGNMSEAQWSEHLMTPGARGLKTLQKYAGNMPFEFFSDVPIRRAGDAPGTLGNIEIDTTPQAAPAADVPMNTEMEAPMPMDNDLGMYSAPPRRMNPSVLSALLA